MVWLIRRKADKRLVTYVLIEEPTDENLLALRDKYQQRVGEPCEAVRIESTEAEQVIRRREIWMIPAETLGLGGEDGRETVVGPERGGFASEVPSLRCADQESRV